ncbi:alkaline phosphatase D family protein [Microlunatus sp. Y2014]|uniref:alkaline phosphatase D family protein n=1 Tax=Microlunatus sp. Y2014 TaxID=3418488 RepID=UPI003DA712E2
MTAPSTPLTRRTLLASSAGAAATAAIAGAGVSRAHATPIWRQGDLFNLGVASGDPTADGVVLWTRLALDPVAADGHGGMPDRDIPVQWELATDAAFTRVIRRGGVDAVPAWGHSVHVELEGLPADTEFWYRFRCGQQHSPIGRTQTMPPRGSTRDLHMVSVSCSHYEGGLFTAYQHAADERPDVVFALGDYIYEGAGVASRFRTHPGSTCITLADFRRRYGVYKAEAPTRELHAAAPWIVTWDDHEIQDNWAGLYPKGGVPTQTWLARRAAGTQAYWENMPLRRRSRPRAENMDLYRRFSWGDLVDLHVLDTRQYRDLQACHDGGRTWWFANCTEQTNPNRTILGTAQREWLTSGLRESPAAWQVLAQSVFFSKRDITPGEVETLGSDGWDGYRADRDKVIAALASRPESNALVLTGDVHMHFANELKTDFWDPGSRPLGAELVTTAISSGGDGSDTIRGGPEVLAENPHVRYIANRRGYVSTTISRTEATARFRTVSAVTTPGAPVSTDAEFVVPRGEGALHRR